MSKVRVFELAKELGLSSKELMAKLQDLGFAFMSHMSTLEEKELKLLRKKFAHLKPKKKAETKKAKPRTKKKELAEAEEKKPKKEKKEKAKPAKKKVKGRAEPRRPAEEIIKAEPAKKKAKKPAGKRIEVKKPLAETAEAEPHRPTVEIRKAKPQPEKAEEKEPARPARPEVEEKPKEQIRKKAKEKRPPAAAAAPEQPEAKRPRAAKKPRLSAAEKPSISEGILEDETQLLLEEKKRIEYRTRLRDRRKRRRERERERARKLEKAKKLAPPPSERLLRRRARGPRKPVITVDEVMTVDELAKQLKLKVSALILELMQMEVMATKNQPLELETVEKIADKHGFDIQVATSPEEVLEQQEEESPDTLKPRAPVVTVMGHVDHGKTALLDVIRSANVVAGEAGGITQHIGAYRVKLDNGNVTFLDTPGHEAFTTMRAHGAHVTDIVVLVVAADDGVMPQTLEAINHARAANVLIVVAINKIDLPTANVDRVKQQMAELDLTPEDWGGKTIAIPVSAKTEEGIDTLLEMLLLEAELLELKANPDKAAYGIVLEAKLDRGRGPVATVLVQSGTLRVGDAFIVGTQYGRVRALLSDAGESLNEAGPSIPVEVLGFAGVPQASDIFITVDDERKARQIGDSRALKARQKEMVQQKRITLEDLYEQIQAGEVKELNIIIKADVQGSIIALQESLEKLHSENIRLNVIHTGVGGINESDIILASASNALVIGFNMRPDANARELAEKEKVDYRLYRVIYDLIDDVRSAMEGLLEPEKVEVFIGRADVLQAFRVSSVGTVAGCRVMEGEIVSAEKVRLLRDGVIVYDGKMSSLKRYKDFARSAPAGTECGVGLENFNDIKSGDVLECYRIEEVARTL
ncbi:MAG: translation initiation factor IF-2 [Candidatus Abyssubacteria bacterium]|nr:translation initiation factor IF-2 [Candidatus Abyssubacteria bacterium]